jgi:CRISPR-associated protein Csm2
MQQRDGRHGGGSHAPPQRPQGQGLGQGGGGGRGNADPARGRIEDLLRPPAQLPRYFAGNSTAPRAELLAREAEEVAKRLATVPASQLRRLVALKRRCELAGAPDEEILAQLTLLRAKAAYTWTRNDRYPGELVAFFTRHAAAVRGREDFLHGFQPHFEAVMAFHKVFEQKDRRET